MVLTKRPGAAAWCLATARQPQMNAARARTRQWTTIAAHARQGRSIMHDVVAAKMAAEMLPNRMLDSVAKKLPRHDPPDLVTTRPAVGRDVERTIRALRHRTDPLAQFERADR